MIGAYMVDAVTIRMDMGKDRWGEPYAHTDVETRGYIEQKERMVQNAMGQLVLSVAKIWLRPRTIIKEGYPTRVEGTISFKDRIVYNTEEHAIISIELAKDFRTRAVVVYVT